MNEVTVIDVDAQGVPSTTSSPPCKKVKLAKEVGTKEAWRLLTGRG